MSVKAPDSRRVCLHATAGSAEEQEMWVHALVEAGAEYYEPSKVSAGERESVCVSE